MTEGYFYTGLRPSCPPAKAGLSQKIRAAEEPSLYFAEASARLSVCAM